LSFLNILRIDLFIYHRIVAIDTTSV